MNAFLRLDGVELWHLAGWTMLHYLWLGGLVMAAAWLCRLVLRHASAGVRYVVALSCLALLAALPMGIAVWLVGKLPVASVVQQAAVDPVDVEQTGQASQLAQEVIPGGPSPRVTTTEPLVELSAAAELSSAPPIPRQSRGLTDGDRNPAILVSILAGLEACAPYLPWLWLIGTPITFALLTTGLVGTRRLQRASRAIDDGPIAVACARLVQTLRIGRRVTVAVCERIAAPVLVGIVRPVILLPPAALMCWTPDEVEMVLLHELAHVRRWDNLVNLGQRIIESLLFFHPAVWWVSSWVRREREACCDAVVVVHTQQPQAYAEMLVAIAAGAPRGALFTPAAASAMAAGPLRARIRRILGFDDDPMLVSGKSLVLAAAGLLLVATLAVLYLPSRGQAEESPAEIAADAGQPDEAPSIADALDQYRRVLVTYDLDFDSVFPQRRWTPPDLKRLERYPTPEAWPDVLGHVDPDPDAFRVVDEKPDGLYETVTGPNAYLVPLGWNIGTKNYATLLLLKGVEAERHVVAHSYTSLACFGPMAGDLVFESYATALMDGDMSGQITANSYFNLVVTGRFTGRISTESYAMVYLMGGLDGQLELDNSKVYIAGRTTRDALARIGGRGHVYLEESDLAPGEHTIGELKVTVGSSAANEGGDAEGPTTADLPHSVQFEKGASRFLDGDNVEVLEVRGTAQTFEPGNIYSIKGTYTLASHDRAKLYAGTTAMDAADGIARTWRIQTTTVNRGSGTFELFIPMSHRGWPHVGFYPAEGGEGFGGTYFGTGDSVLRKWWSSDDSAEQTATSTAAQTRASRFPSLEQQKLADLAWKALGLELEPIGPEDLERVKALGYDGGVRVGSEPARVGPASEFRQGDILVGLHVWPTTSLEDVAKVLQRNDLRAFDPLKYYVVRHVIESVQPGPRGQIATEERDIVVTGRISVNVDSLGSGFSQRSPDAGAARYARRTASVEPEPEADSDDKSSLRYEGKTFDQWRDEWRNELSTERRLEAVRALAAFGANGYGKEAAEAILDVVAQYDEWMVIGDKPSFLPLQNACITAFGARPPTGQPQGVVAQPLPQQDALPVLLGAARSDNRRVKLFVRWVLTSFNDPEAIDALLELSRDTDPDVRLSAINALPPVDTNNLNEKLVERISDGLSGDTTDAVPFMRKLISPRMGVVYGAGQTGAHVYYVPELYSKLFSEHESVRRLARQLIQHIGPADAPSVVDQLLQMLGDDTGSDKQVEAIRALAAMGPQAHDALPALEQLLVDPADLNDPRLVPAAVAWESIRRDEAAESAIDALNRMHYPGDVDKAIGEEQGKLFTGLLGFREMF